MFDIKFLIVSFIYSFFFVFLIIITNSFHIKYTSGNLYGIQKIHSKKVSRIGGLSIFLGFVLCYFLISKNLINIYQIIIVSSLPIFLSGLLEDLTNSIKPKFRLGCAIISSVLFVYLSNYTLTRVDLIFIDYFLEFKVFSFIFTILCITAFTNAMNIIDGLNGLAIGISILILTALLIISYQYKDFQVFILSSIILGLVFGVFVFNFPLGKIFLGDGGAYFIGFVISLILIILSINNYSMSPFVCLLIIIYPLYELLRSFIRRAMKDSKTAMQPDLEHFHSLVFRLIEKRSKFKFLNTNAQSALICILFPILNCSWAILFSENQVILTLGIIIFICIYELFYFILKRTS